MDNYLPLMSYHTFTKRIRQYIEEECICKDCIKDEECVLDPYINPEDCLVIKIRELLGD